MEHSLLAAGRAGAVARLRQEAHAAMGQSIVGAIEELTARDVTDVEIACENARFYVGGTVRGIGQDETLVLRNNLGVGEAITANGPSPTSSSSSRTRTLVAVTDGINRLFANDVFPVRLAREAGLALVDRIAPAKRFFMRHAMGLVGDLPRTMRGGAL